MNKQKDAVQEAVEITNQILHDMKDNNLSSVMVSFNSIEFILMGLQTSLKSSPVDVEDIKRNIVTMIIFHNEIESEEWSYNDIVTYTLNCLQADGYLNTPPQSPVTKESLDKALYAIEKHESLVDQKEYGSTAMALLLMPHMETIRKCLQAVCDD